MAYLKKKLTQLKTALESWGQLIDWPYSDIVRDATIQRYEFTFELLWKVVKIYLKEQETIECNSPKSCFRELRLPLELSEKEVELCLKMAEDRNLSVHTYSKLMAEKLYKKTKAYYKISKKISDAINARSFET
jgi:nucleotidyltransferase substrate binding protein (TIGR01987 family)